MADRIILELENRTLMGKKVGRLRRAGILPATIYGKGVGPFVVQLNARTFNQAYRQAGRATLLELKISGQPPLAAFIHLLQRHPVSREIIHVDFHAVDLLTALTVAIPIHLVGESPLVARGDAILNQVLNTLDVHALPTELPSHIEVDISMLDSFDKNIHVADIKLPGTGAIVTPAEELVISLTQVREAAEEVATEEPTTAEPELVRERREEE